jgi:hypothetical protein
VGKDTPLPTLSKGEGFKLMLIDAVFVYLSTLKIKVLPSGEDLGGVYD